MLVVSPRPLGLPVIGLAQSQLRSEYLKAVIKEGGPISIQTTPQGVAQAIAKVLMNPEMMSDLARRGKDFATKFSWKKLVEKYINLWSFSE